MNNFDEMDKAFEKSSEIKPVDDLAEESKRLGLVDHVDMEDCEYCNKTFLECNCDEDDHDDVDYEDDDYYDEDEYYDEDDDDSERAFSNHNVTSNQFDEAEKAFEQSKTKEIENKLGIEIKNTVIDNNLLEEYNKIKTSQQQLSPIETDEFELLNKKFEENKTSMSKNVETKNTTFIKNLTKLNFY